MSEGAESTRVVTARPPAQDSPKRLLKSGVSPSGRDGHAQDEDAGRVNSSAIDATEDEVLSRPARPDGRDSVFQQPAKRQRQGRDQRRRQLVEAAVWLIGSRGIPGTTVSKISAKVGLSEMAAYRHFASKEEILMEASSYLLGRIFDWLDSSSNPRVLDRLREIGEHHFDMLSSDLEMFTAPYMQFLTMTGSDQPLHHHVADNNRRMQEKITQLIREGITDGSIRSDSDPVLVTHEFIGWYLAEDVHCLTDLRDGTFSRSSHMRTLELILRDIAP